MTISEKRLAAERYLAALNGDHAITPELHALREEALEVLPALLLELDGAKELRDFPLEMMLAAYFMCSYCVTPRKHEIKRAINKILRKNLYEHGIVDGGQAKLTGKIINARSGVKPRCVVVTNHFKHGHVMYRAFGKSLDALRSYFHTTNVCLHEIDETSAQIFDAVTVCDFQGSEGYLDAMRKLRELVLSKSPDVIVYADIAMHPMGVMLSTLRLAPLQVSLTGHPAPSQSPVIDAIIVDDSFRGYTPDFDEPVAFFPSHDFAIHGAFAPKVQADRDASETNIICPVTLPKLTLPYLRAVAQVKERTGARVHITSNCTDEQRETIQADIRRTVPGAELYPKLDSRAFERLIAHCDLFLASFPFSGYNSIHDCLVQGVPGVVMNGNDIASHQAAAMIALTGAASYVARHEHEYIDLACILASDRNQRELMRLELEGTNWRALPIFADKSPGIARKVYELWTN